MKNESMVYERPEAEEVELVAGFSFLTQVENPDPYNPDCPLEEIPI